jgi:recombination protein RecA
MREKVGVMYGSPKTTPGGKALKFYASYRLEVKIKERIKDAQGTVTGNVLEITTVKNKKFPPYKSAEVKLVFGEGVDIVDVLIDEAVSIGLISKSGTWYTVIGTDGETHQEQGKDNIKAYLLADEELLNSLKADVLIDNVSIPFEDGAV